MPPSKPTLPKAAPAKPSTSTSAARAPAPPPAQGRKPWGVADLRGILQGTADPRLVREPDRRGMSMFTFGAMQGAVTGEALLPLLKLLDPPAEGESKMDVVIQLLERIAESQVRIESRLATIESKSGARK